VQPAQVALPQTAPIPSTPNVPAAQTALAAYASEASNRANLPFADLVAPTSVQTTAIDPYAVSLPSIAPTPTPAPSIPSVPSTSGIIDASQLAGKGRSELPTSNIVSLTHAAANSVMPGTSTIVTPGMEPAGRAPVGTADRHPL